MKKVLVLLSLLLTVGAAAYFAGFNEVQKIKAFFVAEKTADSPVTLSPPSQPASISTEKRVALVIGNADYLGDENDLPNDINDAEDMRDALTKFGFEVMFEPNADKEKMIDSLSKFGEKLQGGAVGLLYFSGHGVEVDGEQYIVPTDAKLKTQDYVDSEAISVKKILKKMGDNKSQLNFLILDSCRNNPFPKAWGIKGTIDSGLTKDNAPNPSGVLIQSATERGETSSAAGERNSVYTKHLLHFLNTEPTLEVGLLFRKVRAAVEENSKQTPWEAGSIKGAFYFVQPAIVDNSQSNPTIDKPFSYDNIKITNKVFERNYNEKLFPEDAYGIKIEYPEITRLKTALLE